MEVVRQIRATWRERGWRRESGQQLRKGGQAEAQREWTDGRRTPRWEWGAVAQVGPGQWGCSLEMWLARQWGATWGLGQSKAWVQQRGPQLCPHVHIPPFFSEYQKISWWLLMKDNFLLFWRRLFSRPLIDLKRSNVTLFFLTLYISRSNMILHYRHILVPGRRNDRLGRVSPGSILVRVLGPGTAETRLILPTFGLWAVFLPICLLAVSVRLTGSSARRYLLYTITCWATTITIYYYHMPYNSIK